MRRVVNAGINGDTAGGTLRHLDSAVPKGAQVVILQSGGNDGRKGPGVARESIISEIRSRLSARGVRVVMLENSGLRGYPRQLDGMHLTVEGYRMLTGSLASKVAAGIGR